MMTGAVAPEDAYLLEQPAYRTIHDRLRPDMTVLDIGCGFGYVGRFFSATGARVDGIEPGLERSAAAREVLNRVWTCTLDEAYAEQDIGVYDVVTILDVIEHVVSPVDELARAKRFIAPGGRLFLFVPNSADWSFRLKMIRGNWRYDDSGLFDRTHLRFFDLRTASALCRDAGFKVIGRWPTRPGAGSLERFGVRSFPSLFALHVLFELQPH